MKDPFKKTIIRYFNDHPEQIEQEIKDTVARICELSRRKKYDEIPYFADKLTLLKNLGDK